MRIGRGMLVVVFGLLALAGSSPAAPTSRTAAPPCTSAFQRMTSRRLQLTLTCQRAPLTIVLVQFSPTVEIRTVTRFLPAAGCRASTPTTWYCLFATGVPDGTTMSGSVTFAAAMPRAVQHARVVFYLQDSGNGNYVAPGTELVGVPITVFANY
ncbi:MAG: hypothetical protein JOY73_10540 [Actinobacteria bacterium]|nr:hypothetical protein [Actinomycetota bacterium]